MTDQIADLLVRIRNASAIGKHEINMPFSKMKESILAILKSEGFVKNIEITEEEKRKTIHIELSDKNLNHIKQISKPGQRIYSKSKNIPRPLRGLGLVIISTPSGVITAKEAAKKGLGGELICEIW
jgi:small subunit ribosomal protein S8